MSNEHTSRGELGELGELTSLARESLGRLGPEQSLRGELAVVSRFSATATKRPAWVAPAAVALLATSAAAAVLLVRHRAESAALSYVIDKGSSSDDRLLDVDNGPPRTVRFSDGTEVRVDQGTQARIRFVSNRGAELAMSRGALHAAVVHSATSEWRFDAGPFVVHVTGTAFSLEWDPELDRFDLRLEHGSVSVSSPVVNEPIQVRAGQWLTIRPRKNEVFIRDLEATASNDEREPEREPDSPPSDREAEPRATPSSSASPETALPAKSAPDAGHTWARDLLHGKADRIVDDALRRGLDGCLADSSPSELSALADAARYTRRNDVARRVLLAERRRFPGSPTAMDAALLLGRLAEAEQNDGQALSWFNTYLAEAPGGAHASEALGRKMAIVRHSGAAATARALAEEYLGKYPDGTYSSAARAILESP
jgi:TolA-binding protein